TDNGRIAPKAPPPKIMADDDGRLRTSAFVVLGHQRAAEHWRHPQYREKVSGDWLGTEKFIPCAGLTRNQQPVLEPHATRCEQPGQASSTVAELFVQRIRERV